MSPSPALSRRERTSLVCAAVALALLLHWPLPAHLGSDIAKDLGDPLTQAWQVAWDGHALAHHPLSWFQSNTFWPLPDSLAFSDALAGYAPAGLVGSGWKAAVARYDLLFLFAYALAFAGAYLLARECGARPAAAAVAGAAFAYAPWRLEQDGHLHVISSGGIPLALFLLVRGWRQDRPGLVLWGWAVAAWQFSLGFTLGLQLGYLLALGALVAGAAWWRTGRPRLEPRVLRAVVGGALGFAVVAVLLARPYLRVLHDHPEAHRSPADVAAFSGGPSMFVAASADSRVWGAATAPVRDALRFVPEQTLFPGLVVLMLAAGGLVSRTLPRRLRLGLGAGVGVCVVLSLGFRLGGAEWLYPYRWLYAALPGWQGIRVPGRLNTLTSLGLALLAAGGAGAVMRRFGPWAGVALCVLVLAEGWGFAPHPRVPAPPVVSAPAPQLHLPLGAFDNRRYVLWSTAGFPKLVNGRGSFIPRQFAALGRSVEGFPDARSVTLLRRMGVRSVIVHLDHVAGTPWAGSSGRSVRGLGLQRERRPRAVVFRLAADQ